MRLLFQGDKAWAGILAALALSLILQPAPAASTALLPAQARLTFLGNRNIAPLIYLDGGAPAGMVVNIVSALARHMPRPVEIEATDWTEAQARVARGEADALIQINPTPEREKIFDFSETLLESKFSIFVRTDRPGITGISSLRGLRVGVEAGGLPRQVLERTPEARLAIIPNFLEGFKLLDQGTIDAVVVDYRVGSYILAQNKIENIKATGEPIAFSYSSIAVKKGNTELLASINNALRTIKADGTYQNIVDNWAPKEGVYQTREQITQRAYRITILVLLSVFLIASIWLITLRSALKKRRIVEEKLRQQHSTLLGLINSANALIFSVDRQYRYTSFNAAHAAAMKALYGSEIELGHSLLDYMSVAEDRQSAQRNIDLAFAGAHIVEDAYSGENLESRRYFQVSHSPIKDGADVIGVAVLAQDMTERKRAEDEVKALNEDLDQRVIARTAQLDATNKELEAYTYSVSHDLRTPLRAIDGFSGILLDDYGGHLDAEGKRLLKAVRSNTRRMAQLIDDILDFSGTGRVELAFAEVDMETLAHAVADELRSATPGGKLQIEISRLPPAWGDRAMLRKALANLLSNAVKFSRHREMPKIEVSGTIQGKQAVYCIRDNGVGFDMQYVEKLFGVFNRLHGLTEFEGTGIGLAIVKRIVTRHGGRAWAEGKVDQGAAIHFALPTREIGHGRGSEGS